jgi:hypothetical protein
MLIRNGGGNPCALRQRHRASERWLVAARALLLAAWNLTAALAWATAPSDRVAVTTLRPLLLDALTHGAAHGTLVREAAPFMTQHFGSAAPIEIDVRALHPLPQQGCQRLEVTTTQRAVIDPKTAQAQDAKLVYQISYCANGDFPQAGRP